MSPAGFEPTIPASEWPQTHILDRATTEIGLKFILVNAISSLLKPEGTRRVGKPSLSWLGSVEEDLKNLGIRNWRSKSQDREQWRTILENSKAHRVLYCQKKKSKKEEDEEDEKEKEEEEKCNIQ